MKKVEWIPRFMPGVKKGDGQSFKYRHHDIESGRLVVRKLNDSVSIAHGETIILDHPGKDHHIQSENILL